MEKIYNSPRVSSQFIFCAFPFVLDTYSGCPQHCRYCFSYWNSLINQAKGKNIFEEDSKPIDLEHLERVLSNQPRRQDERELCEFIKRRIPLHWGGISEPFSAFEGREQTGLKALKLIEKYQYPVIISTKNHRIVEGEYFETLKRCKYKVVQVSLISLRPELEKIEPCEETRIEKRLDIIKKCSEAGIRVVVRLQPFIPVFCEQGLEDFVKKVAELGAKAMTVEYLKMPAMQMPAVRQAIRELSEILGYDLPAFYKQFGKKTATDFELRKEAKQYWILKMRDLVHEAGMEFYCADNEFRALGDNAKCCGVGGEEGFQRCSEFRNGRMLEGNKGVFTLADLLAGDSELFEKISIGWLNVGNAYKGSEKKNMSLKDYAIMIWNNGRSPLAPHNFYDNVERMGEDEKGNAIFKIKNPLKSVHIG